MYAYADLECLHRHNFLSFQVIFCSFAPLLTLKIKIWNKCEEALGDIILLLTCTINQDHMHSWYDVWFLRYEVQHTELFCHLEPFFALYPSNSPKNGNIKNEKKPLETSSFYTSVPRIMIIRYTVPEMWRETDVIAIFILGFTFPFYPPNSPKNENFKTMEKKAKRYHNFTQGYQKSRSDVMLFRRYCTCRM